MTMVPHEYLAHTHAQKETWRKRAQALAGKLEGATEKLLRTGGVAVGATLGGVIEGHAGPEGSHILGTVPTNLGVGLAMNTLALFDAAGKHSEHIQNVGDGFLAAYFSSKGFAVGANWKATGKFSLLSHGAGALGAGETKTAGSISPQRMAQIMENARQAG